VTKPSDDRSVLAKATEMASNVTVISVEMSAPMLGGLWLDRWLGTEVAFTVVGVFVGLGFGLWSLLRMFGSRGPGRRRN